MFVSVRSECAELLVSAEQQGSAKSARVLRASDSVSVGSVFVGVCVVSIASSISVVVVCVGVCSFVVVGAISSLTVCSPNFCVELSPLGLECKPFVTAGV